ncbi:MAG: hypothetical protein LBP98_09465, partial [Tannerella sp.]|nr:hypothetical protein [Tannerella sp.]
MYSKFFSGRRQDEALQRPADAERFVASLLAGNQRMVNGELTMTSFNKSYSPPDVTFGDVISGGLYGIISGRTTHRSPLTTLFSGHLF